MTQTRLLTICAVGFSCLALFATIWIVVEPPTALLWVIAVASTEWSLYFGLLGIAGAALGFKVAKKGAVRPAVVAILTGLAAGGLSTLPWIEAMPVARANDVSLSLPTYFHNWEPIESEAIGRTTQTYVRAGALDLKLDIFDPPPVFHTGMLPAVIVVHGGSWHQGNRSDFLLWDELIARHGYAVFDIDYRTAPQPNWKTATGDVKAAVGWVHKNAGILGVDPNRIALMGRSAGAHLALLASYTPGDAALPPTGGGADTHVNTVVSLYGPTDLVWGYANTPTPDVIHSHDVLEHFLGGTPSTQPFAYREASPIDHVGPKTPPTLLIHGGRDLIVGVEHSKRLESRLESAHVMSKLVIIPYALHGFDYDFWGIGSQITAPVLFKFLQETMPAAPLRNRPVLKL